MSLFPSRHYNSSQIYLSLSFCILFISWTPVPSWPFILCKVYLCSLVFIRSPPSSVRAVHVQHCNKSMPRFSQLFPQKYCQDICNASCYLLSPVTAVFPASYWSPFKREHFGCRGVCTYLCSCVCTCVCGCLFLCLCGSLSDWASESVWVYFFTQNTFMVIVSCFGTANLTKNGSKVQNRLVFMKGKKKKIIIIIATYSNTARSLWIFNTYRCTDNIYTIASWSVWL